MNMDDWRKDKRMEEQPLWAQFNCISSNLSGSARWGSHACCSHVEICLFERLWIHSNSVCSSLTGKDHYLEPTDTAQYHLRRIGREFLFKAHRLPLMMTDLIRHEVDLMSNGSRYFICLLWSYFQPPIAVAQVTKYHLNRLKADLERPGRAKPDCF